MRLKFAGLWSHPDFLKLWAGQTVSQFGSQITFLALPLTAILVLDASSVQMGILTAVGALPPLFAGLLVGAWIDRSRRRPILIAADWGRAALIIIVPLAAFLDVLRIEHLYLVAFGLGAFDLFFNVAYRSFFPSLVKREQIVEGNSKLEVSRSAAEIAGPGLGGVLVQLVAAPFALLADAVTFVVSAVFLGWIRAPEPGPEVTEKRQALWKEAAEGVSLVARNPVLRSLAGFAGTGGLFNALLEAVAILYMTSQLELSPALIGLIFSSGSVGLLVGALGGERIISRLGLGQAIIGGTALLALSDLILPLASGSLITLAALLVMGQFFFGLGLTVYNIGQVSLRQSLTPNRLQGRMNATMRIVSLGVVPLGALVGGALGEAIGLRYTLFLAVVGELLAVLWLLFSPVRSLREQPEAMA